ncbi:hypothetical protein SAMN04487820_105150 [Actinopolyspora mzabensis]|uniref:Uncharacterized protein n=1 Tax=Actinopolyspora mzabensis TaxID=995066 RepID=A0A1G8ZXI4_ACTMZ|nr:hypothetical protein SAMN04487820_105150 [Actinopolyspora mzabensis]
MVGGPVEQWPGAEDRLSDTVMRLTDDRWYCCVRDSDARGNRDDYRYWPVLVAVSIALPDSWFLPLTRVRM